MDTTRSSFWEAIPLFKRKLEAYRSYHRNKINIALHVVGIPDIILSLFVFAVAGIMSSSFVLNIVSGGLAVFLGLLLLFHLGWGGWRGVGAALLGVTFAVVAYSGLVTEYFGVWLLVEGLIFSLVMIVGALKRKGVSERYNLKAMNLGLVTMLVLVLFWLVSPSLTNLTTSPWIAGLMLFVMGFYYHVPGHKFFEGNRPALLDDITQSFLAAPQEVVDIIARPLRK